MERTIKEGKLYVSENWPQIWRGWIVSIAVLVLVTGTIWLIQEIGFKAFDVSVPVYNDISPPIFPIFGAILAGWVLIAACPSKFVSVLIGLVLGGMVGNIIGRILFGPVPDYIYIPGLAHYANIADALIIITPIFIIIGLIATFRKLAYPPIGPDEDQAQASLVDAQLDSKEVLDFE